MVSDRLLLLVGLIPAGYRSTKHALYPQITSWALN